MSTSKQRIIIMQAYVPAKTYYNFNPLYLSEMFSYYNWRDIPVTITIEQEDEDILWRISPIKKSQEELEQARKQAFALLRQNDEDEEEDEEEWKTSNNCILPSNIFED